MSVSACNCACRRCVHMQECIFSSVFPNGAFACFRGEYRWKETLDAFFVSEDAVHCSYCEYMQHLKMCPEFTPTCNINPRQDMVKYTTWLKMHKAWNSKTSCWGHYLLMTLSLMHCAGLLEPKHKDDLSTIHDTVLKFYKWLYPFNCDGCDATAPEIWSRLSILVPCLRLSLSLSPS